MDDERWIDVGRALCVCCILGGVLLIIFSVIQLTQPESILDKIGTVFAIGSIILCAVEVALIGGVSYIVKLVKK